MFSASIYNIKTDCCICGGGPAGMMLAYLLSKAGISVTVLEKHKDFLRDFRGDTIHPSTFQLMHDLNLLDDFLKIPHQEISSISAVFNNVPVGVADFSNLKVIKPVAGLMPQWDFLNFLESKANAFSSFHLVKEAEVKELTSDEDKITGVIAQTPSGSIQVEALIIVGCDGRSSTVRKKTNLKVIETGARIDVLWFRLSRKISDPDQTIGRFNNGKIIVQLDRSDYWQCAYIINKGDFERIQNEGLEQFKNEIVEIIPYMTDRKDELHSWNDIKLLNVAIDHLEKWYTEGLICIGDAAHAMSPIGGVGINLAIQDAVATANILYPHLKNRNIITNDILKKIQQRREFPARLIQRMQVLIQNGMSKRKADVSKKQNLPLPFWLLKHFPVLRKIPARVIGIGFRPEKPLKVFS